MIIVEREQNISDLLNSLELTMGFMKLDEETLGEIRVANDELFIVESQILHDCSNQIKEKLLNAFAIIAFGDVDNILCNLYPNLISSISQSDNKLLLKNKIDFLSQTIAEIDIMKSQLLSINNELNDVMVNLDSQLIKIKTVYEKKLPRRQTKTKGLSLFSKYSAGESNGGEFFDYFQNDHHVFLMMSSTDSYLASSSILTIFNDLKKQTHLDQEIEKDFVSGVLSEVDKINLHKNKPISLSLFTAVIDTRTLDVFGHNVGHFNLYSSGTHLSQSLAQYKTNWKLSDYEYTNKIQREDKILIVSPGLALNLSDRAPLTDLEGILRRQDLETFQVLDEIFFQVKKGMDADFLNHDASAILLEVDKNVMHKI